MLLACQTNKLLTHIQQSLKGNRKRDCQTNKLLTLIQPSAKGIRKRDYIANEDNCFDFLWFSHIIASSYVA